MGNTRWGLGMRLVFICVFLAHTCVGGGIASCSENERLALLKFKRSVRDEGGMLSLWGMGNDCCRWERVSCDDATGRVVSLNLGAQDYWKGGLEQNSFAGGKYVLVSAKQEEYRYLEANEVNSCLKELVNLEHLDLSGNRFNYSRIPEFIGSFKQLRYLNLSALRFSGNIPHQFGNLSNLEVLDLSYAILAENDLSWISGLSKLKHLVLTGVNLSTTQNLGSILYTMPSLRKLSLSNCELSGSHLSPHHFNSSREIAHIKHLDLSDNSFSGQLPSLFLNMTSSLIFLDLSSNNIGMAWQFEQLLYMIPSVSELHLSFCNFQEINLYPNNLSFSTHSNIQYLDLRGNGIKGRFPSVLANMSSLLSLDLSLNSLSSSVPVIPNLLRLDLSENDLRHIGIWRQCHLKELIGSSNELDGEMHGPSTNVSQCSRNALEILHLDFNALNDSILESLGRLSNLRSLDLSHNKLSTSIPESLGRLTSLRGLDLYDNQVSGSIPESMGRLINLRSIDLSQNQIRGSIPNSMGELSKLRDLDLSDNRLSGFIPEALGRLTNLRSLDVSVNNLTGPIPEALLKLSSLQGLYLYDNQLSGSIPESSGSLTNLTEMYLGSNMLTGPLPTSLGRLTSLRVFSLASNLLNGIIPNSISKLKELQILDISENSLEGVVSNGHFGNLSMLKYLDAEYNYNLLFNISRDWIPQFKLKVLRLRSCKIEDEFPQWIGTQRELQVLTLSNASISGRLPTSLRFLTKMDVLDLSYNKLTGPLTNLPSVQILLLQNNRFRGSVLNSLCARTSLLVLDLSNNRLTGKIPECLWKLDLEVMILSSNRLSGVISTPSPLWAPSLQWLQLNDNNFSGELPRVSGYFINLVVLDLGENKFSGDIPRWIGENRTNVWIQGHTTSLGVLRLHKNNFSGEIPHSLCKCQAIQILDLAQNNLIGTIPRCFEDFDGMKDSSYSLHISTPDEIQDYAMDPAHDTRTPSFLDYMTNRNMTQVLQGVPHDYTKNLKFVRNMDLSSNKLAGEIPEALTALKELMGLNLSYNRFSGEIPEKIGNMKSLISLDLSANKLTGKIPPTMAALTFLSHLNLSHNNLSGQIPTGNQLQTLTDPSIYAGNTYLCGAPLPKECSPHVNTRSKNKHENANEPKNVWFYLNIMSGFAAGFWGIIGVLLFKKQWRQKLFMYSEATIDKVYVAVAIRVLKMRRRGEDS